MERLTFTERVNTRVTITEAKRIDELVLLHRDLWDNRSHFVRSAIIRAINYYERER